MSRIEDLIAKHCPNGVARIPLKEIASIQNGYAFNSKEFNNLNIGLPLVRIRDVNTGFSNTYYSGAYKPEHIIQNEDLLVGMDGDFKPIRWNHGKALLNQRVCKITPNPKQLNKNYLFHFLFIALEQISSKIQGSTVKHLSTRDLNKYPIPLPPLEVQDEIVRILDSFTELEANLQTELEARRQQYEYYRDSVLKLEDAANPLADTIAKHCPDGVDFIELHKLFTTRNGYTPSRSKREYWENGTIPWFRVADIRDSGRILNKAIENVSPSAVKNSGLLPAGSIIISTLATIGEHALLEVPGLCNQQLTALTLREEYHGLFSIKFLFYYTFILSNWCKKNTLNSNFPSVDMKRFKCFKFPVIPLEVQERIVAILDKFDALVNDLSSGLPAEIAARRKQYEYYRDQLLTFTPAK